MTEATARVLVTYRRSLGYLSFENEGTNVEARGACQSFNEREIYRPTFVSTLKINILGVSNNWKGYLECRCGEALIGIDALSLHSVHGAREAMQA